ncbi:MAG: MBL fold metallo-hydrolase [Candidatus Aenigmatarchaeota archaeon]
MKVIPIAFDSFGVRSMATFVETDNLKVLIDGAAALGPSRYGLKPTKEEYEALELSKKQIIDISKKAELLIVTHYHYDHHPYPDDDKLYSIFKGKKVFAKDINKDINPSGKKRGKIFESKIKNISNLEFVDGKSFDFGKTHIEFSPAVWHGDVGSKVGKVIMVFIKEKKSFLFGSDAQSLADPKALEWAIEKNPDIAIIDGYPTIFVGWKMSEKNFLASKENLKAFLNETKVKEIILDHHIVRDLNYKEKMKDVFDAAKEKKKNILTAAEFLGLDNFFLEAWRREIKDGIRKVNVKEYFEKLKEKIKKEIG